MRGLALCLVLAASPLAAQTFDVVLGNRTLGQLTLATATGARVKLATQLNNTPLGVFNGTYEASSTLSAGVTRYRSRSASTRKTREIDIDLREGLVKRTRIDPASEETALSSGAGVPSGVIDPVRAFALIAGSTPCPAALRFYDGRRVIEISPLGQTETGAETLCQMAYQVTGGPGHLSPLRFRSVDMTLHYAGQRLRQITLKAGVFTVSVVAR